MPDLQPFLTKGISCAAINYRLAPDYPLPAPVHDAARAIQFFRLMATAWDINPKRIALTAPNAGGCTALWLLLHDDLANPQGTNSLLRQSSRVCAAAVQVPQTSINPKIITAWLGSNVLQHPMIFQSVGGKSRDDVLENEAKYQSLYLEFSPINHVDANDPPLFITCSAEMGLPARDASHGIHHPIFGVKLKERSDSVGHECHLLIPGFAKSPTYSDSTDFLLSKLLAPP